MFACLRFQLCAIVCVLAGLASPVMALQTGDVLKPLSIRSQPANFDYQANGFTQLIMVYPADLSSRKIGEFHRKVIKAGFCPKSIVDMENRAWYSPLSLAESEIRREMKNSLNPLCTVTADYSSIANKHWGIQVGPLSIVVDGKGKVILIVQGIPSLAQQEKVIALLKAGNPAELVGK